MDKYRDPEFEVPPTKKARLDNMLLETSISSTSPDDNIEDLYDTPSATFENPSTKADTTYHIPESINIPTLKQPQFTLPGLVASRSSIMSSTAKYPISESVTHIASSLSEIVDTIAVDKSAPGIDEIVASKKDANELDNLDADSDVTQKDPTKTMPFEDRSLYLGSSNTSSGFIENTNVQERLNIAEKLEPLKIDINSDNAEKTSDVFQAQTAISTEDTGSKYRIAKNPSILDTATTGETISMKEEQQLISPDEHGNIPTNASLTIERVEVPLSVNRDPDELAALDLAPKIGEVLPNHSEPDKSGVQKFIDMEITDHADAEFEIDSSPIETSSSDLTSSSSSSDDSDNDYEMLDPEEQARRLMQEDGGSDEESGKKGGNGILNGPLRTLNEKPDEIVEKPNVIVTTDMKIEELGNVEALVENIVLIKAKISGEYKVLETGSVLCLENRSIIGVVAETLGRVQQPLYSVRFTNAAAVAESGIVKGTRIFYVEQHSTYVFTETLKAFKGSDASNIHDEEVGDDELEFSDDEVEAEYKRSKKMQKQARRGGKGASSNGLLRDSRPEDSHARFPSSDTRVDYDDRTIMRYEDISRDDEPYTPLARPSNLHEMMRGQEAPIEERKPYLDQNRGGGWSRGRGDRSRGRDDGGRVGRGRGGNRDRRGIRDGMNAQGNRDNGIQPNASSSISWNMLPPPVSTSPFTAMGPQQQPVGYPPSFPQAYNYAPQPYHSQGFNQHLPAATPIDLSYPPQPYSHQQPPAQQFARIGHTESHLQYPMHPPSPPSNIPPGAFVNPAFFGNQYYQSHHQQSYPSSYPPQYHPPQPQNGYNYGQGRPQSSHESDAAFRAAQDRLNLLQQLSDNPGSR